MTHLRPGDQLRTPVDIAADAAEALADKRPLPAWCRWPSRRIEDVIDYCVDAGTDELMQLEDRMAEELDKRDEEHRTRVNNGGVLP